MAYHQVAITSNFSHHFPSRYQLIIPQSDLQIRSRNEGKVDKGESIQSHLPLPDQGSTFTYLAKAKIIYPAWKCKWNFSFKKQLVYLLVFLKKEVQPRNSIRFSASWEAVFLSQRQWQRIFSSRRHKSFLMKINVTIPSVINTFIHSFNKYFLSTDYGLGTIRLAI